MRKNFIVAFLMIVSSMGFMACRPIPMPETAGMDGIQIEYTVTDKNHRPVPGLIFSVTKSMKTSDGAALKIVGTPAHTLRVNSVGLGLDRAAWDPKIAKGSVFTYTTTAVNVPGGTAVLVQVTASGSERTVAVHGNEVSEIPKNRKSGTLKIQFTITLPIQRVG